MAEAAPNTPSHSTTPALWPPVAIPGQPGAHTNAPQDADLEPETPQPPSVPKMNGPHTEGEQVLADLAAQIARYVILPSPEALRSRISTDHGTCGSNAFSGRVIFGWPAHEGGAP
ncbi:hypothetical protein ACGFYK_36840, partial [Streptomyces sp. NPDC048340]